MAAKGKQTRRTDPPIKTDEPSTADTAPENMNPMTGAKTNESLTQRLKERGEHGVCGRDEQYKQAKKIEEDPFRQGCITKGSEDAQNEMRTLPNSELGSREQAVTTSDGCW